MKRIVLALAASVDSGKTTLSEALLYSAGELRRAGRVDNGDAFLDTNPIERRRGITIFSKQASFCAGEVSFTLLDTPGHVDFAAEAERALSAADCALLVVSSADGVQTHAETLWRLIKRRGIPAFIFVNKTDISQNPRENVMNELKTRFGAGCADFSSEDFAERCAELDEACMNAFLESGEVDDALVARAVSRRAVFPVCFGSALKLKGIDRLLEVLGKYAEEPPRGEELSAIVYKITEDNGARLTHIKINGGTLKVRDMVAGEKVTRLRVYSGAKYKTADEAPAGTLCAAEGLKDTRAGQVLGSGESEQALFEAVLSYRVVLPEGTDIPSALAMFRKLEEEDPQLGVAWNERLREITVNVMGEIQLEVLKSVIAERFGLEVGFDRGSIAYKETIAAAVVGIGHYEPLRHYAEVHLLMEPSEPGSGLSFKSECDSLDGNYQRLVLTHLAEKRHVGVLTGSPITDMRITLVAGRSHIKHTEGGDFRQATYRAVRQGLASAKSVLLEPYYAFTLELPRESVGRAMSDLERMGAEFSLSDGGAETSVLCGSCPVSEMSDYHKDVIGYTHGAGRLSCALKGYFPCHNAKEVIERHAYDFEADTDNPADSVFCSHGAGHIVKWEDVPRAAHVDSGIRFGEKPQQLPEPSVTEAEISSFKRRAAEDKELMAIFERTYGKIKRDERTAMRRDKPSEKIPKLPTPPKGPEYLLVDGYNIIFAWEELKKLARDSLDMARSRLIDIMCNYAGFKQCELILVFDAYKVEGNHRETENEHGITVIYTKEAETADMFIEKAARKLAGKHRVRVATSDNVEQIIILGSGALRVSADTFEKEVREVEKAIRDIIGE